MSRRLKTYRIVVRETLLFDYEVDARSQEHAVAKLYRDIEACGFDCLHLIENSYVVSEVTPVEGGQR